MSTGSGQTMIRQPVPAEEHGLAPLPAPRRAGVWVLGAILAAVLVLGIRGTQATVVDRVVAVVNDEIITLSELQTASDQVTSPVFEQLGIEGPKTSAERRLQGTLRFLIERKLQLQAAHRRGITAGQEEVDQALEEIKARNGISSDTALKSLLSKEKITLEYYLQEIKDQITILKLVNREIRSSVVLQQHDLRDYYRKHEKDFQGPARVAIAQILLAFPSGATDEEIKSIELRAREIHTALKNGADFHELARVFSEGPGSAEGGRLGYFRKGELLGVIDRTVFALQPGEISEPVRTAMGYHIFKLLEKSGPEPLPYEEVKSRVEERLFLERMEAAFQSWVKRLRDQAYVEVRM